jgi:MFS transporter, DHA1 family, multidrug resistance protein
MNIVILLMTLSFASVNAVLFTPALPDIAKFFAISSDTAQLTISWFLVGYSVGQLLYGPIANRFGRKPALYAGIGLQIFSSVLCVLAGILQEYTLLVFGRFLLALGSGVGLNMTITLVSETYDPKTAAQKTSYLMLAFAITPSLSVALGGMLTTYFGWMSCFYACAVYGVLVLFFVSRLPETLKTPDLNALKLTPLLQGYRAQFTNPRVIITGIFMGLVACFVYVFAAIAPFIAIQAMGMTSEQYGIANLLPPIGLVLGSLFSARRARTHDAQFTIRLGISIMGIGVLGMLTAVLFKLPILLFLFLPMILIYFGLSLIPANITSATMRTLTDKANGSAVISFINMGLATLVALSLGFLPIDTLTLPLVYLVLCGTMIGLYLVMPKEKSHV